MTERPDPHDSRDPNDLEDLDPRQFVGDAPVGDASPGDFMSNDQSPHEQGGTETSESDDPDPKEDA